MKLKKSVSLILSIAMLTATLPTISFAETNDTPEVTYAQKRATVEDFNPEATQEPFSNVPKPHTEVVPDNIEMEDAVEVEQSGTISATDIIENIMPEGSSPDAVLNTTSTSNSAKWNALFADRFGDAYLTPYKKSDGQTVSGQTNRLTIRETDLSLPGKNGLDLNITRYHDNQYFNNGFFGVMKEDYEDVYNYFYIYRFIDTQNNSPVYIAFYTKDDFYSYNMSNGITISEYPSGNSSSFSCKIDGTNEVCYYFSSIYGKKNSAGTIQLTYDSTFSPLWKSNKYPEATRHVLETYNMLPDIGSIGNRWYLEIPEAGMYAYVRQKVIYSTYNKYEDEYIGSFRDINGVIHQLTGTGTLREPDDGECTYTSSISSPNNQFFTITQYFAGQILGETGIQYNLTIFDSNQGLTYYMHNYGVKSDSISKRQNIYVLAVVDLYGNMIQYKYDESYSNLLQIIDTYGKTINFTDLEDGKQISYTDENGAVRTIKYEKETLPATELQNGSPLAGREVKRLKVTNAQNETTIYDSREGEVLAYYATSSGTLFTTHTCLVDDYIEQLPCTNIERILYPNGGETRYKYKRYYTSDANTNSAHGSYAVIESYDIVNNNEKNKKTYDITLSNSRIAKTETNTSSGLVTVYNYTTDGMLAESIASATGTATGAYIKNSYTYGTNNQITQHVINNSGSSRTVKYAYKSNYPGMVTSTENVGKNKTTYTYHTVDGKAIMIPNVTNIYKLENSSYVLDYSIQTTLDSTNRAIEYEKVIKNNVIESQTKYIRDSYGRVTSVMQWTDDTNGDGVLDTNDNVITTNTQYTENVDGSVTVTETTGAVSNTYRFGVTGLPYSMTDPKGYTTQIEYDNIGRAKKYTYPNGATETADYNITSMFTNVKDKAGEYTWTYFSQSGLPTSKYFSNSQWTQFESNQYDNADRLTYKKSIYDVDKFTAERYTYDVLSRVATKQVYDNNTLLYTETYSYEHLSVYPNTYLTTTKTTTAEDGTAVATEKEYFDKYGRTLKEEVYSGDTNLVTSYTYDSYDNVLTETDPMGNVTTYTYDIFNNVTSVTYPDNSAEYMYYDMLGRNTSVLDKNSVEYKNTYDNLGRVIQKQVKVNDTYVTLKSMGYDNNGNLISEMINNSPQTQVGSSGFRAIGYWYDNMNNLVAQVSDEGYSDSIVVVSQYWYDIAGRMRKMATGISQIYEESNLPDTAKVTQYGYDIHSNMTSKTDQLGNTTTYTYDYAGNVKTETLGNSTITNTYGPYGMLSSTTNQGTYANYSYTYNNMGMMSSHTSVNGTETISYDAFGRKTAETSNGATHTYSYDLNSRITSCYSVSDTFLGVYANYEYDNMNRATRIWTSNTDIAYTYDIAGNLINETQQGVSTDITYNAYNQPVTMTSWLVNKPLCSYSYTYNWDGNLKCEENQITTYVKQYVYDWHNQLARETHIEAGTLVKQIDYTYDNNLNRTSKTVTGDENYTKSYTYNKRNQLLTETKTENGVQTEVTSYSYDQRGGRSYKSTTKVNDTSENWCYYYWSPRGELMNCDGISVSSLYYYDALGRRIEKYANGTTTDFTWSGDQEMGATNSDGTLSEAYIYGVNGIAINYRGASDSSMYYIKNAHGDVIEVTNLQDTSKGGYIYEAFGGKLASPTNDTNPFQYCGEYYDNESGLIYLRNRYYDPSIGAFISEDPIQDGTNWYTYCGNNPVNYVDPSGESATAFIVGCTVVSAFVSGGAQMVINYATGQPVFDNVGKAMVSGAISGFVYGVTLNFSTAQTAGRYASIAGTLVTTGMNVVEGIEHNESPRSIAIGAIGDVAGGLVGYKITGAVVKNNINSGWFKPQTLSSFFTKSYGKKIINQTIAEGVITAATVSMYENGTRNIKGIQQLVGVDDDGLYGPKTEAAVKKFQQDLIRGGYLPSGEADGIWGEKTDAAFRNYIKDNVMFVSGH